MNHFVLFFGFLVNGLAIAYVSTQTPYGSREGEIRKGNAYYWFFAVLILDLYWAIGFGKSLPTTLAFIVFATIAALFVTFVWQACIYAIFTAAGRDQSQVYDALKVVLKKNDIPHVAQWPSLILQDSNAFLKVTRGWSTQTFAPPHIITMIKVAHIQHFPKWDKVLRDLQVLLKKGG
jgi:hypothetical protein